MSPISLIVDGVTTLVRLLFGNKSKRDAYGHAEMETLYTQFAAEFRELGKRTLWDSLVDGLNRLPRPLMTFGTIGLFIWCASDPKGFTEAMVALQAVPELMWYILLTIVAFWFGGKLIEGAPKKMSSPPLEALMRLHHQQKDVPMGDFQEDQKIEDSPFTNQSLEQWQNHRKSYGDHR